MWEKRGFSPICRGPIKLPRQYDDSFVRKRYGPTTKLSSKFTRCFRRVKRLPETPVGESFYPSSSFQIASEMAHDSWEQQQQQQQQTTIRCPLYPFKCKKTLGIFSIAPPISRGLFFLLFPELSCEWKLFKSSGNKDSLLIRMHA